MADSPPVQALLVFEEKRVRLVDHEGDVAFHPGMAYQRIRRMAWGVTDPLVEVGRIGRGHRVLDGTLGLGQDALVAAAVVGPEGRVVGLEASPVLAAFAAEGLPTCALPAGTHLQVSKVVAVHHAEASTWLASTEEEFDRALLDPMFGQPKRAHPSFEVLRRHAMRAPLDDGLVTAALERATTVVVKVGDLASLRALSRRPERVQSTRSAVWATFARR